MIFCDLL